MQIMLLCFKIVSLYLCNLANLNLTLEDFTLSQSALHLPVCANVAIVIGSAHLTLRVIDLLSSYSGKQNNLSY